MRQYTSPVDDLSARTVAHARPYLVDGAHLRLPPRLEPIRLAGHTIGVLGLIEYLPAVAVDVCRAGLDAMRRAHHDEETPGIRALRREDVRELRRLARRRARDLGAAEAEGALRHRRRRGNRRDGGYRARLVLDLSRRGPAVRARVGTATLQDDGVAIVRFRGSGTAWIGSARMKVREPYSQIGTR